jgi:hypothetical protein
MLSTTFHLAKVLSSFEKLDPTSTSFSSRSQVDFFYFYHRTKASTINFVLLATASGLSIGLAMKYASSLLQQHQGQLVSLSESLFSPTKTNSNNDDSEVEGEHDQEDGGEEIDTNNNNNNNNKNRNKKPTSSSKLSFAQQYASFYASWKKPWIFRVIDEQFWPQRFR